MLNWIKLVFKEIEKKQQLPPRDSACPHRTSR